MPSDKLRVVFDCNIFWRAFFHPDGLGGECKRLVSNGTVILFLSDEILSEVTDVLTRRETLGKFPMLAIEDVHRFLREVYRVSIFVSNVPSAFEVPRDTKDEPYINLAVDVGADFIVTTDYDLLDLMTGVDVESKIFRQKFRPLKIVSPRDFLNLVYSRKLSLKP